MNQYQHLYRIAGKTWGINKNIRRLLYKTVIERTLCHGAVAWGHNMTSRLQKKLDSIQRLFLLYITGAYRTTLTAALQEVTGLQPLHLQIQQEATYARIARARSSSNFFTVIFSPTDYESKSSRIHIHPPNFVLHSKISFAENHRDLGAKAIYTDGSKTDEGTGSAYCILENHGIIASWQGKLDHSNSVFQAEILAIKMAIETDSSLHRPIKIWTDSLSSLMAILNPKSHHSMVREIQTLLLSHKHIHLRWLKAHIGYLGNECADQLVKEAITKGDPFFLPKPLSYLKSEICTHDIVPRVSNKPVGWNREEIMFVTGHGPFPSYLHRFNLRTYDNCSGGEKGDPMHYATKCRFTLSWHFQTPTVSLKLQWLKNIHTNNLSRTRLRLLMRFICDENNLIVEDNN
ncbi:hypothetical protein AVEN_180185-1 [Araneus ventricosus]|uniref:RNase H type-1 domain-containing protein n=1 Tax=Araneus ventricosus TaxID=182803 RepID=A0A4Y2AFG0_ARAVE|nr:hypothetical protein AVEN_102407-1 [Araneus ventricosus]GBL78601.1 hypothetical protein AVEN_9324-1 [Araneus ventricosus]GBL78659.1 hypothetical protein AVEN_180185-1 [Araneus ventricosus]